MPLLGFDSSRLAWRSLPDGTDSCSPPHHDCYNGNLIIRTTSSSSAAPPSRCGSLAVRGILARLSQRQHQHRVQASGDTVYQLTAKDVLPTQLPISPAQDIAVHGSTTPQHERAPLASTGNPQLHTALNGFRDAVRPAERRELEGVGSSTPGGEAGFERVCGLEGLRDGTRCVGDGWRQAQVCAESVVEAWSTGGGGLDAGVGAVGGTGDDTESL